MAQMKKIKFNSQLKMDAEISTIGCIRNIWSGTTTADELNGYQEIQGDWIEHPEQYSYIHTPNLENSTFTMGAYSSEEFGAITEGATPGEIYKVVCVPMGEIYESFGFAFHRDSNYYSAIPFTIQATSQWVKQEGDGYLLTIPPQTTMLIINFKRANGIRLYKVVEKYNLGDIYIQLEE